MTAPIASKPKVKTTNKSGRSAKVKELESQIKVLAGELQHFKTGLQEVFSQLTNYKLYAIAVDTVLIDFIQEQSGISEEEVNQRITEAHKKEIERFNQTVEAHVKSSEASKQSE